MQFSLWLIISVKWLIMYWLQRTSTVFNSPDCSSGRWSVYIMSLKWSSVIKVLYLEVNFGAPYSDCWVQTITCSLLFILRLMSRLNIRIRLWNIIFSALWITFRMTEFNNYFWWSMFTIQSLIVWLRLHSSSSVSAETQYLFSYISCRWRKSI